MPVLYVYDYCLRKTVMVKRSVGGPYYSRLVLKGGARGKRINYRNRSNVCIICTRQGTKYCTEVAHKELKESVKATSSKPEKDGKERTVVVFRSQRRREK